MRCLGVLGLEDLQDGDVTSLVQFDPPLCGFVDYVRIVILHDDPVPLLIMPAEVEGNVASGI